MRYNPETERGITLEAINDQCWKAVQSNPVIAFPTIARVWDCQNGGWIQGIQATPVSRLCATIF